FLEGHVKPAIKPADEQVKTWLADLGHPEFKKRETAHEEIARAGELVEPALRRSLETTTDVEVRRRLNDLLDRIPRPETRPEQLRALRAIEVLEYLNDVEARRLLAELTKGDPAALLTREAKGSLARLERK